MALEQELARVERARDRLGQQLDEVESRFEPKYLGAIAKDAVSRSAERHPAAWAIGATAAIAGALGWVAWALLSDD